MNCRALAVLLLGVLLVLAGCAGTAPGSNQTAATAGTDLTAPQTPTERTAGRPAASTPTGTQMPTDATETPPTADTTTTTAATQSNSSSSPEGTLDIHYINVGQGDATLIVGPTNETMLIDTGDYRDDGETVLDYLRQHNINRIDYLITTHADADHIGGHEAVIDYYETQANGIGAVYDPGLASSSQTYDEYLDAVEEHDVPLYETRAGDPIPFEGVKTEVLAPPEPYLDSEQRNENSIVLRLTLGQTSFMLPGDVEEDGESYLVDQYGGSLRSAVLKSAHHGSAGSNTGPFLDAVQPQVAVISSAYDSQYGHPSEEALQRLADRDIDAYWTATHGNIVMTSDGETISIATQQTATTDPDSLRDAQPVEPGSDSPVEQRATITIDAETTSTPTPSTTSTATQTATETESTPAPTPTVTDDGAPTGTPASSLAVAEVHADAEGDESDNLNDEYIMFENSGSESLDLSGWTVADAAGREYTIPSDTVLSAGETITLHTGEGTDTETDLYWGSGSPVWNNDGDTIIVTNNQGERVIEEDY